MRKIVKTLRDFYISEGVEAQDLDTEIKMADIQYHVPSAGPGLRTEIFFQGCSHACQGCINYHLWSTSGGRRFKVYEVLGMLDPVIDPGYYTERGLINLTIGGGEPFEQLDGLSALVRSITRLNSRGDRGRKHILVYSGYTLEELLEGAVGDVRTVKEILKLVNVLVDGRFQDKLVCLKTSSSFIGSDNQRYLVLDKRGKVIAEADASTANSILGDIRKQHLLDLEVE